MTAAAPARMTLAAESKRQRQRGRAPVPAPALTPPTSEPKASESVTRHLARGVGSPGSMATNSFDALREDDASEQGVDQDETDQGAGAFYAGQDDKAEIRVNEKKLSKKAKLKEKRFAAAAAAFNHKRKIQKAVSDDIDRFATKQLAVSVAPNAPPAAVDADTSGTVATGAPAANTTLDVSGTAPVAITIVNSSDDSVTGGVVTAASTPTEVNLAGLDASTPVLPVAESAPGHDGEPAATTLVVSVPLATSAASFAAPKLGRRAPTPHPDPPARNTRAHAAVASAPLAPAAASASAVVQDDRAAPSSPVWRIAAAVARLVGISDDGPDVAHAT